ncbi:MAG: hypothetical protein EPO32_09350 [Anaerolineae bacterium]|nr:MAG: hypothetical protein EPO32_09350 [Anaerolineae bacterium]
MVNQKAARTPRTRIQVGYFGSYNMPPGCVACGNPVTPHVYQVGKSSWNNKQHVWLKFPICEECNQANKAYVSAGRMGCLGGLLMAAVGYGFGSFLDLLSSFRFEWLPALCAIVGLFVGIWLVRIYSVANKPPEVRERVTRLLTSVTMVGFKLPPLFGKGWIKLDFANPDYASQFMMLNGG